MLETFFGFKKTPFADNPDAKQLFASEGWRQVKTRLELLTRHPGVGLLTGEVGAGKSTAARFLAIVERFAQRGRERGRVLRRHEPARAAVLQHFGVAAHARRDDRRRCAA